ncbi:TatD family hydrolase [Enterobacteriaceae bacterium LUAb1]
MSLPFIDTHCHFDFPPFAGREAASLQRATAAGIAQIIVPAVAAEFFPRVLALAEHYPPLWAALGLHPVMLAQHQESDLAVLEMQLRQAPAKLIALGEIGLDFWPADTHFDYQQRLLDAQLKLAKQYDLPVILHSRRAHDKLAMCLRRAKLARCGVVHGFSGSLSQAQAFIKLGYAIGVGGTITYQRAAKTRNTIARLPLSSLLLETDAPDMPLQGFQGQPNRPERLIAVFDMLCQLRPEPPQLIAEQIHHNTQCLFAF